MLISHRSLKYLEILRSPCTGMRIPNRNIEIHNLFVMIGKWLIAMVGCVRTIIGGLAIIWGDPLISHQGLTYGAGSIPANTGFSSIF